MKHEIHKSSFVAKSAIIIGNVKIGKMVNGRNVKIGKARLRGR